MPVNATNDVKALEASGGGEEYLIFALGNLEYGIEILKVQEIRGYDAQAVTPIPNARSFVKGVTNLRGVILPVVDMRERLGLTTIEYTARTAVIVLALASRLVGMVVDGVSDVQVLQPAQVSDAPQFASKLITDHLSAIGTVDDRMLLLLDIERLMESEEMDLVERPGH
ncbi:MAG: chemotaxis protein CheW [Candidimonas sp.]|nr:MAG: chemotaxis protein CheW [Candidimonas sp.]